MSAKVYRGNFQELNKLCAIKDARIADLEAALKLIASGMEGDRFLADWELSDIANKALTPKRDQ